MPVKVPEKAILAEADQLRSLCVGLPVTRVEFEDGVVEWHPKGAIHSRGTVTIFADDERVQDTRQ